MFKTINTFDLNMVYIGIALFSEALLSLFVCVLINKHRPPLLGFVIFRTALLFLQCAIYIGKGTARKDNTTLIFVAIYLSIAYNIILSVFNLGNLIRKEMLVPVFLSTALCMSLFSNSFIIYGAMVGRFLLTSMIIFIGMVSLRRKW